MKLIEGVVERINAKDIDEDQWGNTCRLSLKIGEEWVSVGTAKKPEINLKEGAGWYKLKEQDKIAIVADETEYNGKTYLNGRRKTIEVLAKGNGAVSSSQTTKPSSSASSPKVASASASGVGTDWARKDAGAAASASIDKALRYIQIRQGEVKTDYGTVLSIARDFQQMVRTLADEILAGPAKPAPEPEKPVAAPVAASVKPKAASSRKQPEPDNFDDDDIPF